MSGTPASRAIAAARQGLCRLSAALCMNALPAARGVAQAAGQSPSSRELAGGALYAALLLYPLAWSLGLLVSNSYWFLPVGIRVAGLLRVPVRWWWALLLGEYLASSALNLWLGGEFTFAGALMANGVPWAMYAVAILVWRRQTRDVLPRTPQSFAQLLLVGLAAAALTAVNLLVLRLIDERTIADSATDELFRLMVGDFVGIVLLAPVLVQLGDPRAAWRVGRVWRELVYSVLPLAAVLALVSLNQPAALPYLAMFALAPPLWLARRSGWRGAALAFTLTSAAVYWATSSQVSAQIASLLQFYLALVGAAALILGAWVGFERRLRSRLERGLDELADANARLEQQTLEMRQLGRRLVSAQEDERARIRADLRGELGQQISTLATHLSLLVRRVDRPELMAMLDGLRAHVQTLRDAAEDCLENLQPRSMVSGGLLGAVRDGPPARALGSAGVRLEARVGGDEALLSDVDRMQVYRLVQHMVALTLRFSDAVQLQVDVEVAAGDVPRITLSAVLRCRSPMNAQVVAAEPDMQAIRDRMFACSGDVQMRMDGSGSVDLRCTFETVPGAAAG